MPQRIRRDDRAIPHPAENLLDSADFSACIRDDTLDAGRTEIILRELRRAAGTSRSCLPQSARKVP